MRNKNKEGKRMISVGIFAPEELDRDTIYVNLERNKNGIIFAEAVSLEDFKYETFSLSGDLLQRIGKNIDNQIEFKKYGGIDNYISHNNFIRMLAKKNCAKVNKDRILEDALKYREFYEPMKKVFTNDEIENIICLHDECESFYEKHLLIPDKEIAQKARSLLEKVKKFSKIIGTMELHEYRLTTKLNNSGYSAI